MAILLMAIDGLRSICKPLTLHQLKDIAIIHSTVIVVIHSQRMPQLHSQIQSRREQEKKSNNSHETTVNKYTSKAKGPSAPSNDPSF